MQVFSIVINSLSRVQWTTLVTGRYMITMMMLLCYVNLSGGQCCTDSVNIQQNSTNHLGRGRLAIFPRLNFTCNGRITNIKARVFNSRRRGTLLFQVWRPSSAGSTVYNKIGEVQLQSNQVTGNGTYRTANIILIGDNTIEFQSGDVVGYYHPSDSQYLVREISTDGYVLYRFDGSSVPNSVNLNNNDTIIAGTSRQPLIQLTIDIRCDNLSTPVNGEMMSCSSGRVGVGYEGDNCSFTCNTGYELTGSDTRICQSDGSWSGSPVSCIIMECPSSSLPMNSILTESCSSTYQSMCELQCQEGFNGTGDPSYMCDVLSDGSLMWMTRTEVAWTCPRVQCLTLMNGTLQCPNGTTIGVFEDTCTFFCNTGYELQGSNNGTCLANQSWSGGDPICVALNCSTSPPLNNSQLQSSCNTQYQSTCITVCVDGYTGVGGSYTCVVMDEDINSVGWNGSTSCQKDTLLPNNPSGGADPHFMCPLKNGNNLCFSVQGIPDFIFNLFSDSHLQLNAKFSLPEFEESQSLLNSSTFMQELGFTVKHPITNIHTNVKISALDHSISVAGSLISVKNYPMIIKIINNTVTTTVESTPVSTNPGETPWVKIITDIDFSLKLKFVKYHIDFVVIDSSGLSKQAHGIQGQFMGADVFTDEEAGIMRIGNHRAPFAIKLGKIWPCLNIPGACWYPVKSDEQGEGVIEGVYTDYIVDDLFGNNFKYNQFK